MKEFGIKIRGEESYVNYTPLQGKIKATTQSLSVFGDEKDYIPFLKENGKELPIKYTRFITENYSSMGITKFEDDKPISSEIFKHQNISKIIHFEIEEI